MRFYELHYHIAGTVPSGSIYLINELLKSIRLLSKRYAMSTQEYSIVLLQIRALAPVVNLGLVVFSLMGKLK